MANYCVVKPKVKVNGEFQDSELFESIKSYTFNNYTSAKNIYLSTIHNAKKIYKEDTELPINNQGELSIETLINNFDIRQFLPKDFIVKLKNQFNLVETDYTAKNYAETLKKCQNLNNSIYGNNYFATAEVKNNKVLINIKWKLNKDSYKKEKEALDKSVKLSTKIIDLLNKWNISIDTLYDAEARLSNGITDFTSVEKASDGLYHIIKLAKGEKGLKALPEELGHVVVTALLNNSVMQRTLNLIKNKELVEEILGDKYIEYYNRYHGDIDLLAEEAAGKLIAIHFIQQLEIEDDVIYKQILGRTINQTKTLFSKCNETEISNAINEVNDNLSLITKKLINNDLDIQISSRNLNKIFYQVSTSQEKLARLRAPLIKILENENRRAKIYANDIAIRTDTIELLKNLKEKIKQNDYADAIILFLQDTNEKIKVIIKDIEVLNTIQNKDLKTKASKLRHFRNIIFSYTKLLQDLNTDIHTELTFEDSQFDETIKELINEELKIIGDCLAEYNRHSKRLVEEYFAPILGNKLIIDKGWLRKKPIQYTAKQVLDMDVNDISWFDMMLDSAADSDSYLVKGIDTAVKEKKGTARQLAIEFYYKIANRTKELEKAGYKNQDWAFERDSRGLRTGYYITKYNRGEYEKARNAEYDRLLNSYPKDMRDSINVKKAIQESMRYWDNHHSLKDYINKDYEKLTTVQKEYIKDILNYKIELDKLLPPNSTDTTRTIKIRKDILERIKSSHSIKDALNSFTESVKENFVRNSTETEFGIKSVLTDFEGFEYRNLPVFYVHKGKETSEEDISTDIVSTMTAYAAMAYENYELSDIIDILETTHSLVRDSANPFKTIANQRLIQTFSPKAQVYQRSEHNRILDRINSFFDMQIYHQTKKDEGTIGQTNIDKGKAANVLMHWSETTSMSFNTLANISNVLTGNFQFKMESMGGQFFGYKDATSADIIYHKHLMGLIADFGNRVKSSWLWTVSEAFNVMQDYEKEIGDKKFDKNWYERISIGGLGMLLQNAGEFWMQHRTFFALMNSNKELLKDSSGNDIKAIDAFEVKPINKDNPENGSELIFKSGLIVQNGKYKGKKIITKQELLKRASDRENKVLWTDKSLLKENEINQANYIHYMSRKSAKINQGMHGIYNEEDKATMYSYALGRLAGQYRKWIKPALNRRFRATKFDYDLDTTMEGTYRTVVRMIGSTIRTIRSKEMDIIVKGATLKEGFKDIFRKDPKLLQDYEAANLRHVLSEWAIFALILLAIGLLPDDDEPEKEKSYISRLYKYQLYRLKNEIGVLIPGPYMIKEGVKLVQSPMASISLLEKVSNAFDLFTPWNWKEIKSGRYEGWYKPFNTIMDLVPYNRSIYKTFHPEEGIAFYM